jgi:hypothetical protein
LPNCHFLAEEKYPSKSRPEEEGNRTASPFMPSISVELYIAAAVSEATIEDPFIFDKLMTSKHYREKRRWSLLQSNQHRLCLAKPLFQSFGFGY